MRLRSLLFTPANGGRKVEKALTSDADAVILDLEDAVAVSEKPAAREAAVAALLDRAKPVFVRVNALATPHCFDDLLAIVPAGPDAIVLPKVERASDVLTAEWAIGELERRAGLAAGAVGLAPIIETGLGVAAAGAIAAAGSRLRWMMFGAVDLALDMDIDLDDEAGAIGHARFTVALASRTAGLPGPIDTAFVDIQALDRLRASAGRARAMGYSGKACIHPLQIPVVNELFSPSARELERSRRIVAAFEAAERAGSAAVAVDGAMIDYPVVRRAQLLLAQAGEG
ncbi:MAG TPA: CoA ester lyase [Acetobacteraceae bacterium]|nr:CoA ester lyase [Acetobacteraceae bacterium]